MSGQKVSSGNIKCQIICTVFFNVTCCLHIFSRFNRTKIRWSKNSKFLAKTRNIKLSKKGALRILDVSYRDAGIFACHAGHSLSELRLRVKPKPGDREPTPADYESVEEEEDIDDIDLGDIDEDDDEALSESKEGKVLHIEINFINSFFK